MSRTIRLMLAAVSLWCASCSAEDYRPELSGDYATAEARLGKMTPEEIRACLSGEASGCPEIQHYSVGAVKPSGIEIQALITCPDRINLPSSATGWNGIAYTRQVNAHDAYCWGGTCTLACQVVIGGAYFEVYNYYYGSQCYPEQTTSGTRFFECF